jgi:hypothetical protein
MSECLFSWINFIDGAVMTAGAEVATLPVNNLKDSRVQKPWRSLTTSTWFQADFGGVTDIDVLGLFGCLLAETDTVRHRLDAVTAGAGVLLDTGAIDSGCLTRYKQHVYPLASTISARYWRCDISATSRAAAGFFDIGRAFAGAGWMPTVGFSIGWGDRWVDLSEVVRSKRSAAVFVDVCEMFREMALQFDSLTDADRLQALEMDAYAGRHGQILFVPSTESASIQQEAILGRMQDTTQIRQETDAYPLRYAKSYSIQGDG